MKRSLTKDKFQILNYELNVQKVEKIFGEFLQHKTEPVLIKGLAAAQNYPKPFQRTFSDIDIAVDPSFYERARKIIKENEFNVDLHKGLRHLDISDWDRLFQNSKFINIGTTKVRVLRAEDHLRVLSVHWLNDGGADRTRLWDIYFAIQNKPLDFDWELFIGAVCEKRKRWLITVILLAKVYLGLKIDDLPGEYLNYELPEWVIREVEKEWQSDNRLLPINQVIWDKKQFIKQVKKRLPPNALQAVVENDAFLTDLPTKSVLVENFFRRIRPSLKRILGLDSEN